jgi:hypothetical protein
MRNYSSQCTVKNGHKYFRWIYQIELFYRVFFSNVNNEREWTQQYEVSDFD